MDHVKYPILHELSEVHSKVSSDSFIFHAPSIISSATIDWFHMNHENWSYQTLAVYAR
jgi:hypothetical protein